MKSLQSLLTDHINEELVDPALMGPVDADTELLLEGYLDSVSVVHLVTFIGERVGIEVPPEHVTIEHFGSVRLLAEYLERRGGAAALEPGAPGSGAAAPGFVESSGT